MNFGIQPESDAGLEFEDVLDVAELTIDLRRFEVLTVRRERAASKIEPSTRMRFRSRSRKKAGYRSFTFE